VGRRRFEHLYVELSLAVGRRVPRYRLWTALGEAGASPEHLTRDAVLRFCDEGGLRRFLAACGLHLPAPRLRRLRRAVARYDPRRPSPEEVLARL